MIEPDPQLVEDVGLRTGSTHQTQLEIDLRDTGNHPRRSRGSGWRLVSRAPSTVSYQIALRTAS